MKKAIGWVGAIAGVGVPIGAFFSSYPPPLFPGATLITAGLSAVIFGYVAQNPKKRRIIVRVVLAVILIVVYVVLLQFTSLPVPPKEETRVQIGFGVEDWNLTENGKAWKKRKPDITAYEMADREAAFKQENVYKAWQTRWVYCAGACLILLYLIGFALWTSAFAALGIGEPGP